MRRLTSVLVTFCVAVMVAVHAQQQVVDPLPNIEKRGLTAQIRDVVRLPDTRACAPRIRKSRRWVGRASAMCGTHPMAAASPTTLVEFCNILNGSNPPSPPNVAQAFPLAVYLRLESGFISFTFHPEFARNGLFYTVHSERAAGNPAVPNFIPPGFTAADVTYHNIITEWHATNPGSGTFEGTRRELLRVAHVVQNLTHPMGAVEFNPTAKPGSARLRAPLHERQRLRIQQRRRAAREQPGSNAAADSVVTAILRIDPEARRSPGGRKGSATTRSRWRTRSPLTAIGPRRDLRIRLPQRAPSLVGSLRWDDVRGGYGMSNIEEINIVRNGGNYGWMKREGYWDNGRMRGGTLDQIFALPDGILKGREKDGFTYPVAIYDHNDGQAITGGYTYHGTIPALRGKFIFGDIQRGRIFASDVAAMKKADDGIPETVAPVEEIQLYVKGPSGNRVYVTLRDLVEKANGASVTRADLQISRSKDGEIFITSRQDGTIRMLVAD
jgi:hypothetical protein